MERKEIWRPWTPQQAVVQRRRPVNDFRQIVRRSMLTMMRPSRLESLPPELFHQVLKLLSNHERACLAMCNKSLLKAVGINLWTDDPASLDQKFIFLHLLIRDSPAWLCYRCKCAHYGRQMFPGLWDINPMRGASWKTIVLGNPRPLVSLGLPYCDFDISTRAEVHGNRRVQRYASALAYPDDWKSNLALDSTFSTITLPSGEILGHKHFVFWARYGEWNDWRCRGRNVFFSEDGMDLGINLDLCKHLSLRRTQPDENAIADILQCGWTMASHKYHGDECTNATCQGGYRVPRGHHNCTEGRHNMRHRGACKHCPTEFVVEMWPHWSKQEKVLDIKVWHDLSDPTLRNCSRGSQETDDGDVYNVPRRNPGILQSAWIAHADI